MFIRSERLFLRPCWPEDCEELFRLLGDETVAGTIAMRNSSVSPGEPCASPADSREAGLPQFLITLPGSDGARLIGTIALARFESEVEIFFCVVPAERGHGYAAEAVRAVLALVRALGLPRVAACCFADDRASAAVLERAGFVPTGATRLRPREVHGECTPACEMAVEFAVAGGGDDFVSMRAA